MVHDAGHEISYDYDGDLDMSNIPNVDDMFSHSNEDNSIGKIDNKIMNLILCIFLHCIFYYTRLLIYSDKTNIIYDIPRSPPTLQRRPAYKTPRSAPPPSIPVLCKSYIVCGILILNCKYN